MNDSELQPLPQSDLAARVAVLQRQVSVLLLALLVVTVTLAAYLRYQDYILHKDAATIRPQAAPAIKAFAAASAGMNRQAITNFLAQLGAYGQKNPDFAQQVLKKYGFAAAPAAGTQPKPAPAPPKK
jgi:hypothetical protein